MAQRRHRHHRRVSAQRAVIDVIRHFGADYAQGRAFAVSASFSGML